MSAFLQGYLIRAWGASAPAGILIPCVRCQHSCRDTYSMHGTPACAVSNPARLARQWAAFAGTNQESESGVAGSAGICSNSIIIGTWLDIPGVCKAAAETTSTHKFLSKIHFLVAASSVSFRSLSGGHGCFSCWTAVNCRIAEVIHSQVIG